MSETKYKTIAEAMLASYKEDEEQVLVYEYFDKRKSVKMSEIAPDHLHYLINPRRERIYFADLRKRCQAPVCTHSWKPYMGFTENYNYCEHCGVKENENSGD